MKLSTGLLTGPVLVSVNGPLYTIADYAATFVLFCFVFCLVFIMVSGSNCNNYANTIHYLVTSLAIEISYMFVYLHYHPHLLASIFDAGLGWMA